MIDQTNVRIGQATAELSRRKAREQKFDRLLKLTDVVLWQLEEMNRDGVKNVPPVLRAELKEAVEIMPDHVREPLRADGPVQDTLDSLFEIQERLFKWRYPDWDDTEPDELEFAD